LTLYINIYCNNDFQQLLIRHFPDEQSIREMGSGQKTASPNSLSGQKIWKISEPPCPYPVRLNLRDNRYNILIYNDKINSDGRQIRLRVNASSRTFHPFLPEFSI